MDARTSRYHDVYARSMRDPEGFWGEAAQAIDWYEPAKRVFDKDAGVYGRWFTGAVCNTCYNAIDRHVERGRGDQPAIIYDSPVTNTKRVITYAELLREVSDARRGPAGLRRRQGRPRHPLHADGARGAVRHVCLRAHRRDPFGRVRRVRRERACDAHRRRQAEADAVRLLRHRGRARRAVQAAARCGDRSCEGKTPSLPDPATPAMRGAAHSGPRPRLGDPARQGARGEQDRSLRAGARDRSALHPLHVGHDRHSERRGARQWRPHGRARLVDEEPLRRRSRRGLLGGLRHRLGGRAQLHRLRAAVSRLHHDPLRRKTGRHAGRGRVLARHLRAQMRRDVHRADRVPRDQEGRSAGQILRDIRSLEIPHAVPRRRARRPGHDPVGREPAEGAGDRSLVADRDRLGDRRQSDGAGHAAGEARLSHSGDAGLRRAHRR